jgi:hypothetical protein
MRTKGGKQMIEEFDAEAELKKYDDTSTTVFYWSDTTPNRTLNSLRNAAKHLKENPGKGPLAELIAHGSVDRFFSGDELRAILAAV